MTTLIKRTEQITNWKELSEGIKAGSITLAAGDEVKMELQTGEKATMQVVEVSEDGKNVKFVSHNCLAEEMPMNSEWTNKGGWKESDLRKRLNSEVFDSLPEDLKAVIIPTIRRQFVCDQIVECEDKLWIPSEFEIHGREIYARHVEGEEQFKLYEDRRNRMKKIGEDGDDTDWYWCDSPHASDTTTFCYVYNNGYASASVASTALGVPLCFTI